LKASAAHKRFLAERRKGLLRRRFLRDGLNLGLLLLALNALARNLGPLALAWCQALALGSLFALAGINLRLPVRLRSVRELAAGLGLLLGCGWGLRTADQSSVAVSLVAPATLGIALALRGLGAPLRGAGGYVGTAAVYGLWVLVSTSVPWLGDGLSGISRLWSQWIGETFLRQPLLAGPTGLGGGILMSAVCYLLVVGSARHARRSFGLRACLKIARGAAAREAHPRSGL